MTKQTELETEYAAVQEQIRTHTAMIKEAVATIQHSKDEIAILASRLSMLHANYQQLVGEDHEKEANQSTT